MKTIKKQLTIDIEMNPKEVAYLFQKMDDSEQAEFFNHLADFINTWDSPFVFQLQGICDSKILTSHARKVMAEIGNYSQEGL